MLGHRDNPGDGAAESAWGRLPVRLALAWVAGLVMGYGSGVVWPWVIAAAACLVASVGVGLSRPSRNAPTTQSEETIADRRLLLARWLALAAVSCAGAGWLVVQRDHTAQDTVARYVHEDGAIVRVVGVIASPPRDVVPDQGSFGAFNYREPGTLFELDIEQVDAGRGWDSASGAILVRIKQHDDRPKLGQRIEATGWLSAVQPPQNPGEFDYREYLKSQGVFGRMTLMRRGNWRPLGPPPRYTLTGLRSWLSDAAARSLHLGLPHDPQRTGLLEALLLGRRTSDIDELSESFRDVGLAHILSISGAHLGILLVLVWWIGRLLIGRPAVVAWLVMAVLVLFLLAVPWRTPIIRAAVMAGVFGVGVGLGRRLTGVEMLAGAALIVLVWKPTDLFSAGFQLSFGAVGGLLLFAKPVSHWLYPEPEVQLIHPGAAHQALRWFVDFVAVSVVAFLVAVPLVMFHFQLLSPLAAVLSMLALPVLTGLLGVGYLKMLVGLLSPTGGALLAMPTSWLADSMVALVEQSRRLPGATVKLDAQPSVAWACTALAVVVALLAGAFRGRWIALPLALMLVIGWALIDQRPTVRQVAGQDAPALEVVMFGVGDGSCYLLRSGDAAAMYDCGSQAFLRIGERSIVPALRELGVARLELLFISHPDLDHFVGVLDVIDAVAVGQVVVSAEVLREAERSPGGAASYMVDALRERGYEPVVVAPGWRYTLGEAELEVLWPSEGFESEVNNNHSLVLRASVGHRRLLLNGDIQGEAIEALIAQGIDLQADVTDLAHHGSYVEESPAWFEAVSPALVLQSSGPRRPEQDRWADYLEARGITRLTTDALGMVRVSFTRDGRVVWTGYRGGHGQCGVVALDDAPGE